MDEVENSLSYFST